MGPSAPAKPGLSVRDLPPAIFAVVMATGIVSLAINGAGYHLIAQALFWLNVGLYAVLWVLLITRVLRYRANLAADLRSHAKAPGFFTLVAAPCVLGNQCVLLFGGSAAGLVLWIVGVLFWLALSYAMVPGLMEGAAKPKPEEGLNGAWLLTVVGTQAVSLLACLLVPAFTDVAPDLPLFVALAFWLVGSMLYIWLIAFIFHRILFLPLLHHGTFFPSSDFFRQPGPQTARTRVEPIACTRPQQLSMPREDEPPLISTTFVTTSPSAAEATE